MELESHARTDIARRLREKALGRNLGELALTHGVTIRTSHGLNKGWAGLTLERVAELSFSNLPARDGDDFELKSLKVHLKNGVWAPRETIRITQLNPQKILMEEFETSTLWAKLSSLILVGCDYCAQEEAKVVLIKEVDLNREDLIRGIRTIWEDVWSLVANGEIVQHFNIGTSNDLIQLRPTGTGKESSSCPVTGDKFPARAFYATKKLLTELLA